MNKRSARRTSLKPHAGRIRRSDARFQQSLDFFESLGLGPRRGSPLDLLFTAVAICDELSWIGFVLPRRVASGCSRVKASLIIGSLCGFTCVPLVLTGFRVVQGLSMDTLILGWFAIAPWNAWDARAAAANPHP